MTFRNFVKIFRTNPLNLIAIVFSLLFLLNVYYVQKYDALVKLSISKNLHIKAKVQFKLVELEIDLLEVTREMAYLMQKVYRDSNPPSRQDIDLIEDAMKTQARFDYLKTEFASFNPHEEMWPSGRYSVGNDQSADINEIDPQILMQAFADYLKLESDRQLGAISKTEYLKKKNQLLEYYRSNLPAPKPGVDDSLLREKLATAQKDIETFQKELASLKAASAQTARLTIDKWIAIVTSIITILILLSTNIIAWRQDRRLKREMKESFELKVRELELKNSHLELQLDEKTGRIITPSLSFKELKDFNNRNFHL